MLFVFELPATVGEAHKVLDALTQQAITVMAPDNRRRLGQRRNKLNAYYDQLTMLTNTKANSLEGKDKDDWIKVAERVTRDKKILTSVKDQMQMEGIQLY